MKTLPIVLALGISLLGSAHPLNELPSSAMLIGRTLIGGAATFAEVKAECMKDGDGVSANFKSL
jgi:hypothetical protein